MITQYNPQRRIMVVELMICTVSRKLLINPAHGKQKISSKQPRVTTRGILELKQSLPAVFFALLFDILPYYFFRYTNR